MTVLAVALGLSFLKPVDGLRPLAEARRLNLGAAVSSQLVQQGVEGGAYARAIKNNFTMIEPENDLKPPALWLGIGSYNFANSDFLVNWAIINRQKVRGHVLVYADDNGYTIPRWLLDMESSITPFQAKVILHDYILSVAGRYKGKIFAWDVINEAIADGPTGNPFNLRNSFWYRKLGVGFVAAAFRWAHEADPKCKLYYNDYNIEGGGSKADQVLAMVDYLKSQKVPIDGIGLQYHRWVGERSTPGDGFYTMLSRIQSRKLGFMITELDVSMPVVQFPSSDPNFGLLPTDPNDLTRQADTYGSYFRMALSFNNCQGIQTWGVGDLHSWIPYFSNGNNGAALLMDKNYFGKPAYDAVANALAPG